MKANIGDKVNRNVVEGHFAVSVVNRETGEVVDSFAEKNVIVLDARTAITRAIAGDSSGHIADFKLGTDVGAGVSMIGTPTLTFSDANPDTITRSTGSWIDDGFLQEMTITVSGSVSNDNTYTIDTLTDTVLTLVSGDTLVSEIDTAGVAVTGVASPNVPEPAKETYDENTMTLLYDYDGVISVGYPDQTSVNFNVTISGEDVMTYYPSETSVVTTSAALHTADGNVFAYKRFPQKSISALLDINIVWTISY